SGLTARREGPRVRAFAPGLGGHGPRRTPQLRRQARQAASARAGQGPRAQIQREPVLCHRGERGRRVRRRVPQRGAHAPALRLPERHAVRLHDRPDLRGAPRHPHRRRGQSDAEHALLPRNGGRLRRGADDPGAPAPARLTPRPPPRFGVAFGAAAPRRRVQRARTRAMTTTKKGKKKGTKRERTERRFEAETTYASRLTALTGMAGGLALGAGVYAQWVREDPLAFAPYLVAGGGVALGGALFKTGAELAKVRVGDAGVALEK